MQVLSSQYHIKPSGVVIGQLNIFNPYKDGGGGGVLEVGLRTSIHPKHCNKWYLGCCFEFVDILP